MASPVLHEFSWDRMIAAVEDVRLRARRVSDALSQAGIVGGHAVASWEAWIDREAVRNTKDVDLLVRRSDFERVIQALETAGFIHQNVAGIDLFLDGPAGSVRSAVYIVFAAERVDPEYMAATLDITDCEPGPEFPVPTLEALVRMKLTSFRLRDKLHLLDLLDVGLIDASWRDQLHPALAARLDEVIATHEREG